MNKGQGARYYPIFLNAGGKKCMVVGGGQVALRKVTGLLEHGADVTVISPDLCPGLAELVRSGEVTAVTREYQGGDLANAFLVIVATDSNEVNRGVVAEARRRAVPVNVVDDAQNSDFILPSYLHRGEVTVAVSTGGASPALARKIRLRLEGELGDEYAELASVISEVRAEIRKQKIKVDSDGWQQAIDLDRLLGLLKEGDRERARLTLLGNLQAIKQKVA